MHRKFFRYLLSVCLTLVAVTFSAQSNEDVNVHPFSDFRQITKQAGMIIAGRVILIEPVRLAGSDQIASLRVTVQVEQGIRGARSGERATFSEWAGLWSSGERYRVGERLLLFLYPPSAIGLTSPVGGGTGRLAIDERGRVLLPPEQDQAIRTPASPIRNGSRRMVHVQELARALRRMEEE